MNKEIEEISLRLLQEKGGNPVIRDQEAVEIFAHVKILDLIERYDSEAATHDEGC